MERRTSIIINLLNQSIHSVIRLFIINLLTLVSFVGLAVDYKLDDLVYESQIKSVLLYPNSGQNTDMLQPPVVPLKQAGNLVLKFDELGDEFNSYYAKIINCDANWVQSTVPDLQFLGSFNEFNFTQYNYSINTFEKYIHYTFSVPAVKLSGNYVLVVYRDGNIDNTVITRRFIVTENLVNINLSMLFGAGDKRLTHQTPSFTITYPTFDIQNSNQVRVVVRQNGRWDNAYINVKPLYTREVDRVLDYQFFNNELSFPGGNEYRVFDTRSLVNTRLGVAKIMLDGKSYEVNVVEDQPRGDKSYILQPDVNGWYVIYRQETNDGSFDGDYAWVNFTLKVDQKFTQPVLLFGKLTDWKLLPQYQMVYNEEEKVYKLRTRIKQGYYNYGYVLWDAKNRKIDETTIEGSHAIANNYYEIIVYFTPFGSRSEQIIGYRKIQMN